MLARRYLSLTFTLLGFLGLWTGPASLRPGRRFRRTDPSVAPATSPAESDAADNPLSNEAVEDWLGVRDDSATGW